MNRLHRFDILAAWYKEHLSVGSYSPRTIKDYFFELSLFRRHLEQKTQIEDIDDLDAEALRTYLSALYDKQYAPATINRKVAALRSFFKALYTGHKLYTDLSRVLSSPRVGKRLPTNILTEEECAQLFAWLEENTAQPVLTLADVLNRRDRAILEVFYSTGIRRNELLSLRLGDLNADDGLLVVHCGKGGKDRVVPIGQKGLEAVQDYIRLGRPMLAGTQQVNDWLFLSRFGGALSIEGVRNLVKRILCCAGIKKHIRVHDLRHTCATHLLNHGADIRYVQELLGHSSLSSTQIYTHVSINKLKESHRLHHPREREGGERGRE